MTNHNNHDSQLPIRLRYLSNKSEDIFLLQSILERAADHRILTTGLPLEAHAAEDMISFNDYPVKPKERYLIGLEIGLSPIGYAWILRGFPKMGTTVIVDLILVPDYRGKGFGRRCYDAIERLILQWEECTRIRIGVLGVNSRVVPFWRKMGFIATGERFNEAHGSIKTETIVFEKIISRI